MIILRICPGPCVELGETGVVLLPAVPPGGLQCVLQGVPGPGQEYTGERSLATCYMSYGIQKVEIRY